MNQIAADTDEEAALLSEIANDHVTMPLENNQNYGYIGIFYVGSGEK